MKHLLRSKALLISAAIVLAALAIALPLLTVAHQTHAAASNLLAKHGAAKAQMHPHAAIHPNSSRVTFNHADGTRYLYVEDGNCPDGIDVYKIATTLTFVGTYATDGCSNSGFYGSQTIAVTPANSTHGACLVYANTTGSVESYPINADGSLGTLVSKLIDNANPSDVHISSNGNRAYVVAPRNNNSQLESYQIGGSCTLTTGALLQTVQLYVSLALVDSKHLVSIDFNTGTIDTYAISTSGSFSLLNSVPGQFGNTADSVAVGDSTKGTNVFTGSAVLGPASVQGGQYSAKTGNVTFLPGSPAADPNGNNGAAITYDNGHNLLIQGQQQSSSLGVYRVSGTKPGKLSFLSHVLLAQPNESPTAFAQSHNTLFVDGEVNGDVEACVIGDNGVSNCATIATLPYTQGFSQGIAVLKPE